MPEEKEFLTRYEVRRGVRQRDLERRGRGYPPSITSCSTSCLISSYPRRRVMGSLEGRPHLDEFETP